MVLDAGNVYCFSGKYMMKTCKKMLLAVTDIFLTQFPSFFAWGCDQLVMFVANLQCIWVRYPCFLELCLRSLDMN